MNEDEEVASCNCCGKTVDKLLVFEEVGPYAGAKLIKMYRPMAPELEGERLEAYKAKCTEEEFSFYEQLASTIESSWECRDCACLTTEEYFKKRK
jgi:hypothetical protein